MSAAPGAAGRLPAPAVTRSLQILTVLADAEGVPMSLSTLARELSIAKSSAANLCQALEDGAMIQRVPTGYTLGRRTVELGGAYAMRFNQVREFLDVCAESEVLHREVVQIAMLDGTDTLYLARHEGRTPHRLGTPLGSRLPAALTASGRALLMRLDDAAVRELLADRTPFPRLTARGVSDLDGLLERLAQARERGYAVDLNESYGGITGVAVPLPPWTPGDPPLALGAALPVDHADETRISAVGEALLDAADRLTNPFQRTASAGAR